MTLKKEPCDVQQKLEAYFLAAGEAPEDLIEDSHIATCEICQETFDRLAIVSREIENRSISSFELAMAEAAIFDELDGIEEANEKRIRAARGPKWMPYLVAAAVAGLLSTATLFIAQQRIQEIDDFQARSATHVVPDPHDRPQLELFCADRERDTGELTFRGSSDAPFGALSCPLEAELKLAYTNPDPRHRYAAFFGISPAGDLYWYGPSPADGAPMTITTTSDIEPIGESIRLTVNHEPGLLRVHAIFSPTPLDFDAVSRIVKTIPKSDLMHTTSLDRWVKDGLSTSRTLDIIGGAP
ncbi:MAG: hypothetical protein ACNA8W_22385 [Bradymonadaceae bacterium]